MATTSVDRVSLLKAFYTDILDVPNYIPMRRSVLRKRAGLKERDARVPPFSFVSRFAKGPKITEYEVEQEENLEFLGEYLAQFCERLPSDLEVEEALAWASRTYALNPHLKTDAEHVAWASIESGVQRGFASYVMGRFQRTPKTRGGPRHDGMKCLKEIIHSKLEAAGMLTPEGKKQATRGPSASSQDLSEKMQEAEESEAEEGEEEEDAEQDEVMEPQVEGDGKPVMEPQVEGDGKPVHPDEVDTLPMFLSDFDPGVSPNSKKYLKEWKIVERGGQPVLVKRDDADLEEFEGCQRKLFDSQVAVGKDVPPPEAETTTVPNKSPPEAETTTPPNKSPPNKPETTTPPNKSPPKEAETTNVPNKSPPEAETTTPPNKSPPNKPETTTPPNKSPPKEAETTTVPNKTSAKEPEEAKTMKGTKGKKAETTPKEPQTSNAASLGAVAKTSTSTTSVTTVIDDSDEDDSGAFRDATGKPLVPTEVYMSNSNEKRCEKIMQRLSPMDDEDLLQAQKKMRRTLKEAEEEDDDDKALLAAEEESEMEDERRRRKGKGKGRGKGRGKGKTNKKSSVAKEKNDQEDEHAPKTKKRKAPKTPEEDYEPEYPDNQQGLYPDTPKEKDQETEPTKDAETETAADETSHPDKEEPVPPKKKTRKNRNERGTKRKSEAAETSPFKRAKAACARLLEQQKAAGSDEKNLKAEDPQQKEENKEKKEKKQKKEKQEKKDKKERKEQKAQDETGKQSVDAEQKMKDLEASLVEAFKTVREVANSDSLFILPPEIQDVLRDIDNNKSITFIRKNFTLKAPKEIDTISGEVGTIGVGLSTRSYFASGADPARIKQINASMKLSLNANVRRGVSLSWARFGALKAWTIAKYVAGWAVPPAIDEESRDDHDDDES